jgi:hypothetical protein
MEWSISLSPVSSGHLFLSAQTGEYVEGDGRWEYKWPAGKDEVETERDEEVRAGDEDGRWEYKWPAGEEDVETKRVFEQFGHVADGLVGDNACVGECGIEGQKEELNSVGHEALRGLANLGGHILKSSPV